MSSLGDQLVDYVARRRRLGFVVRHDEDTLRSFVKFCDAAGLDTVTTTCVVAWATAPVGVQGAWMAERFRVVRLFAQHLHVVDDAHEVPPARLIVGHYKRIAPYLYNETEIVALIEMAGNLTGRIRPIAYQTLIGLLAATGMRISEALALNDDNVDLVNGLITIRNSKFNKSRCLPIHPSTVEALTDYVTARTTAGFGDRDDGRFFVSDTGRRIDYRQCQATFRRCVTQAGLTPAGHRRRPPRIHDLRHTFAVNTLIGWYQTGVNVNTAMPYLSTYLGHLEPAGTYWYLTGSPELAAVVAGRLDAVELVVKP